MARGQPALADGAAAVEGVQEERSAAPRHAHEEVAREPDALDAEAQTRAGLDEHHGEGDGNARAPLEDVVQVAVARVVVLLLVAAKAALAEEVAGELGDRGLR